MLTPPTGCEPCVEGAYASHHIFTLEAAPPHIPHIHKHAHTHTHPQTHTHALVIFATFGVCVCVCACSPRCGRLSAPPGFPDCVPVCLPALRFVYVCLYFYLSVCLLCEVRATRAFLIASSLLRHQNTVKQSRATVESVWREETEEGDQ